MEISSFRRIIFPLTLILGAWLFFEVLEFLRLGGANQPIAFCIVKISVLSSTIIGLSANANEENIVNFEELYGKLKALSNGEK